jgi:hypothetical protein
MVWIDVYTCNGLVGCVSRYTPGKWSVKSSCGVLVGKQSRIAYLCTVLTS